METECTDSSYFDALEPCINSQDALSVLETSSINSHTESQVQYSFALTSDISDPFITSDIPKDIEEFIVRPTRQKIRSTNHATVQANVHRPLPLRSYETEAHLSPTSHAEGASTRGYSESASSRLRDTHTESLVMPVTLPTRTSSLRQARTFDSLTGTGTNPNYTDVAETSSASVSATPTPTATATIDLASFPSPQSQNPVGVLPMLVSRMSTPPQLSSSQADMWRHYTKNHMSELLEKTRARGSKLARVDWDALSPFERTWREVNDDLLVAIYTRVDVVLTAEDVQYVECIVKELADPRAAEWARLIFQGRL
jgi:hypothetical protein